MTRSPPEAVVQLGAHASAASDAAILSVYADVLSQAVTGELVGALNYGAMAPLGPTEKERSDAEAHARSERRHANTFRSVARGLELQLIEEPRARHWGRVRDAFEREVAAGDWLACTVIQELMLESFAVALYDAFAGVPEPRMARTFAAIAREEAHHLEHALASLRPELLRERDRFEALLKRLHFDVVAVLAEMISPRETSGPCGLCARGCVKKALGCIGLDAATLRGKALRSYLHTLDRLGVRSDESLRWLADLPL